MVRHPTGWSDGLVKQFNLETEFEPRNFSINGRVHMFGNTTSYKNEDKVKRVRSKTNVKLKQKPMRAKLQLGFTQKV